MTDSNPVDPAKPQPLLPFHIRQIETCLHWVEEHTYSAAAHTKKILDNPDMDEVSKQQEMKLAKHEIFYLDQCLADARKHLDRMKEIIQKETK